MLCLILPGSIVLSISGCLPPRLRFILLAINASSALHAYPLELSRQIPRYARDMLFQMWELYAQPPARVFFESHHPSSLLPLPHLKFPVTHSRFPLSLFNQDRRPHGAHKNTEIINRFCALHPMQVHFVVFSLKDKASLLLYNSID